MYKFKESMKIVKEHYLIPYHEQLHQMKSCLNSGLRPFEYFDCAMYSAYGDPADYIGISQASLLFKKHSASRAYIKGIPVNIWLDDKSVFNELCKTEVRVPFQTTPSEFIKQNIPFVIKPSKGYGGKGIHIFEPLGNENWKDLKDGGILPWNSLFNFTKHLKGICEHYLEPNIIYNQEYKVGCLRILVYFRDRNKYNVVNQILRLKHNSNIVDNFGVANNAILGIWHNTARTYNRFKSTGYITPPLVEFSSTKLDEDKWKQVYAEISQYLNNLSRHVHAPEGMYVGFDVLVREEDNQYKTYWLEGNSRPIFSAMQIANRKGLRYGLIHSDMCKSNHLLPGSPILQYVQDKLIHYKLSSWSKKLQSGKLTIEDIDFTPLENMDRQILTNFLQERNP